MYMKNLNKLLCTLLLFISAGSQAGLIGDKVLVEYRTDRFLLGKTNVLVSPQIELRGWNNWIFDFTDTGLTMYSDSNTGYGSNIGFVFSGLNFGSNLILSGVLAEGINQSRVSFTDDSVSLNFSGLGFSYTQKIFLTFQTEAVPVPEPSTLGLIFFSLAGLAILRRRQTS